VKGYTVGQYQEARSKKQGGPADDCQKPEDRTTFPRRRRPRACGAYPRACGGAHRGTAHAWIPAFAGMTIHTQVPNP
jgi:hypothetical protein